MAFRTDEELAVTLSPEQEAMALTPFPSRSSIEEARYFDNYDLPCSILVTVRLPDGGRERVVLRECRHGDVGLEADLLETLARLGLPVPRVLARSGGREPRTLLSLLPGTSLQALAVTSPEGLEVAQDLLIEATARLACLTERLEREPVAQRLPRRTLADDLESVAAPDSPWVGEAVFREVVEALRPVLCADATPLVFTNGDDQPGNFLAEGGRLTGFVDFESAGFQDPLLGFAKFPIYDVHPMNRAGFIPRLLAARGWTQRDFAPRLALGCLVTLQREVPVHGGDAGYREHVLALLRYALEHESISR